MRVVLAAICAAGRNWTGAADCLKTLLEIDSHPGALARHSLALARVYEEGFANAASADRDLELVLCARGSRHRGNRCDGRKRSDCECRAPHGSSPKVGLGPS